MERITILAQLALCTMGVAADAQLRGRMVDESERTRDRQPFRVPYRVDEIIGGNVTRAVCGGIAETVCENPQLRQSCRALSMIDASALKGVGTFFAPVDSAWEQLQLSPFVTDDLGKEGVMENLLLFHSMPGSMEIGSNETATAADVFDADDLECNGILLMANGGEITTECIGDDLYLVGDGNLPVRTLPKLVSEEWIETCDESAAIYLVSQVILPPLPIFQEDIFTTEPVFAGDECPASEPEPNGACRSSASSCEYNHVFTGCTWEELTCTPISYCNCVDGTWMCIMAAMAPCIGLGLLSGFDERDAFDAGLPPNGLPWGDSCDPNAELPTPPPEPAETVVEGRLSEECPDEPQYGRTCTDSYVTELSCDYDYIYVGCSWSELGCYPIVGCDCDLFGDGTWACWSAAMMGCPERTTPQDLPWGRNCNPEDPLPLPPDASMVAELARGAAIP